MQIDEYIKMSKFIDTSNEIILESMMETHYLSTTMKVLYNYQYNYVHYISNTLKGHKVQTTIGECEVLDVFLATIGKLKCNLSNDGKIYTDFLTHCELL